MLESFDGRQELEDHEEDEDEAGEDDRVDVSLDADEFGEYVAEIREKHDGRHTTPNDDPDAELQDGLMVFASHVVADTLVEHEAGENENDDLVEME